MEARKDVEHLALDFRGVADPIGGNERQLECAGRDR
jgi:hypothetical protein